MKQVLRRDFATVLFVCLMLIFFAPAPVSALEQDGFVYTIADDAVTITGYSGTEANIVIPAEIDGKPVVAIGNYAFSSKVISTVDIPDSVRSIGRSAFSSCTGLVSVDFPAKLDTLGPLAFYGCSHLGQEDDLSTVPVILPPGLKKIEDSTFSMCQNLMDVSIPEGVTSIGQHAFYKCRLYRIILPDTLIRIDFEAFRDNKSLSAINIPDNVSYIGRDAFYQTPWLDGATAEWVIVGQGQLLKYSGSAVNLILPASIRRICSRALLSRSSLRTVYVPDQVTEIDYFAFANCKLTSIRISPSVSIIQDQAFDFGNYSMTIQGYPETAAAAYAAAHTTYAFQALALATFDALGGTAVASQEKIAGSMLDQPQQPSRTGHQFSGWYLEKSYAQAWNFATDAITQSISLYARWQLPVPTGLSAVRTSPTSVTLTWSSQSGADGFEIYRATAAGGPYTLIRNQSGTSYTDSASSPNKIYYQILAWSESDDVITKSDRTQPLAVNALPDPTPTATPKPTATPIPSATPKLTVTPAAATPTATATTSGSIPNPTMTPAASQTGRKSTPAVTTTSGQTTGSDSTTATTAQTGSAAETTQEQNTTSQPTTAPVPADQSGTQFPWVWVVVFAILIGQSVLITILFLRRKAK